MRVSKRLWNQSMMFRVQKLGLYMSPSQLKAFSKTMELNYNISSPTIGIFICVAQAILRVLATAF